MNVTGFFCSGLPGKYLDQGRLATDQALQRGLHFAQIIKVMHALGSAAQLPRSLRAAEQQFAEDGRFAAIKVEGFLEAMLVFGDPAIRGAHRARKRIVVEYAKGVSNGIFLKIHDRIAIRFLVARVDQRVEGKRIVIRSGDFLFQKRAENSGFDFIENGIHSLKSYRMPWARPNRRRAALNKVEVELLEQTRGNYRSSFSPRLADSASRSTAKTSEMRKGFCNC